MTLDEKIIDACGRIRNRDDAVSVVQAAVASERERCAKIADDYPNGLVAMGEAHVRGLRGSDIAAAIRKSV